MELETIEPSHSAFAFLSPASHGFVTVFTLDMSWPEWSRVYDGYAGTLSQSAGLEEQQKVHGHICLTLDETVVRDDVGKFFPHLIAYISYVECLQITEMRSVKQNENCHNLAVGHASFAVTMALV